ncbi:MAG: restriction endonuclease [Candidatus Zixiibacteriota bacterium]
MYSSGLRRLRDLAIRSRIDFEIDPRVVSPAEPRHKLPIDEPILRISNRIWEELIEQFADHPEELHRLHPRKFEEMVAEMFRRFGYVVEFTSQTRDGGRDIVAIRYAEVNTKYLIECKRPEPGSKIGIRPVRELLGVKSDEGASKAILATTSYFTRDALCFFERNKWDLEPRDCDGVLSWVKEYLRILGKQIENGVR